MYIYLTLNLSLYNQSCLFPGQFYERERLSLFRMAKKNNFILLKHMIHSLFYHVKIQLR